MTIHDMYPLTARSSGGPVKRLHLQDVLSLVFTHSAYGPYMSSPFSIINQMNEKVHKSKASLGDQSGLSISTQITLEFPCGSGARPFAVIRCYAKTRSTSCELSSGFSAEDSSILIERRIILDNWKSVKFLLQDRQRNTNPVPPTPPVSNKAIDKDNSSSESIMEEVETSYVFEWKAVKEPRHV